VNFGLVRRVGALLLLTGMLAACSTAPPAPAFPELTYRHLGAMTFDAGPIEIVDEYRAPLKEPNIEHKVPIPPALAMRRWALDRLADTGNPDRRGVFTIQQAALTETRLPQTKGLRGIVTTDQSERYELTLAARLELFEVRTRVGIATATVTRARTVPEDATLNERDRILFEMVEAAMLDFNKEMEASILRFLRPHMR
jgi:hypothetical protein